MNNREAVNWLINISADIGKAEHSDLWHYEQALTEIKDMIESAQPKLKEDWLYDYLVGRLGKSIVDNKEEFHKWFERMVWHVKRCDELSEERRSRQWIPCEEIQPEKRMDKRTETHACDSIGRQVAIDAVDAIGHIATMPDGDKCIRRSAVKYTLSMLPLAEPEHEWIPVTERLPDNADHPEAFCPRYQVTTPYGVTEGWYRPHDHEKGGQWYALFWFMSHRYEIWNIDFERGDVPKVIGEAPVMAWRPFPEAYKEVSE